MKKTNKIKAIIVSAVSATILASVCVTASAVSVAKADKTVNDGASQSSSASAVWSMKKCGQNKSMAEKISGLKYAFPEFANYEISAMPGMIEVQVNLNDNQYITFRQSTEKGDITGIYNDYNYKSVNDARISGVDAKFAKENGRIYAAYWSNGAYGFSLYNENGISENDAISYVQQLTSNSENADAVWEMQNCGQDKALAEKISGLDYAFPEYANYEINAMPGMIEVRVNLDDNKQIIFRQSTEKGDITGVYNDYNYKSVNDARISDVDAKFAVENGKAFAGYWSYGDNGFSFYAEDGISQNDAISYVQQLTSNADIAVQAR